MTYSELLNEVPFDEIMPFIEKYHKGKGCMALYKTHYDMLRNLIPQHDDNKIVSIGLECEEGKSYLSAYPLEGDLWEKSLAKEIVVDKDIHASLAEIAACCLWHSSFYGFTKEQIGETLEEFDYFRDDLSDKTILRKRAEQLIKQKEEAGGTVPKMHEMMSVPSFRKKITCSMQRHKHLKTAYRHRLTKEKRMRKKLIANEYYERILITGSFVIDCLSATCQEESMSLDNICKLFYSNHYRHYCYKSYASNPSERTRWMMELIKEYDAFNMGTLPNVMICVATSSQHPFVESEHILIDQIMRLCTGNKAFALQTDDSLEKELKISVSFYE